MAQLNSPALLEGQGKGCQEGCVAVQLVQMLMVLAADVASAQGWQQDQRLPRRGHVQCGHLLKQKAKSAASERWMAMRLCWNNKGICLFSTCCIAVGKIKCMYSARFLLLTLSATVELIVEELLFVLWIIFLSSLHLQ